MEILAVSFSCRRKWQRKNLVCLLLVLLQLAFYITSFYGFLDAYPITSKPLFFVIFEVSLAAILSFICWNVFLLHIWTVLKISGWIWPLNVLKDFLTKLTKISNHRGEVSLTLAPSHCSSLIWTFIRSNPLLSNSRLTLKFQLYML